MSLACLPVFGDTFNFSGDTTSLLTFNRPTEPGDDLSLFGTSVHYFVETFTVSLSGNYNFSVVATDPSNFDTFIQLYSTFNPSLPLGNYIAGNDDNVNGPEFGSALNGIPLIAGNTYTFVIDGFSNSDFGAFTASISGPGVISPVPEPSTLALATGGFLGLWLLRRRLAQS